MGRPLAEWVEVVSACVHGVTDALSGRAKSSEAIVDTHAWRDAGLLIELGETIAPRDLARELASYRVLDVREASELEETGAIPGASNVYVGHLEERLGEVRSQLEDAPVAVVCSVGHRAGIAASVLRRHGIRRVTNLLGGMTAWTALKLPITGGHDS